MHLKVSDPGDRFLNRVISVISVVLRETTPTFSDFTEETVSIVSIEYEVLRVVSLSTTEISEETRLQIRSSG